MRPHYYLQACLGVLKRDLKTFFSYRGLVISQVFSIVFSLTLFYYISRLVSPAMFPSPDDYYAFIVIGLVILGVLQSTLNVGATLRSELVAGTFERFIISPFGAIGGIVSMLIFPFTESLINAAVTLGLAALIFDLPVQWSTAALALPVGFLGAFAFGAFGLFFASLVLIFKQAMSGVTFFMAAVAISAGLYFPISLLPGWIQWTSEVQPFTPAVELMRHFLLGTPMEHSVGLSLVKLTAFALVLAPLGAKACAWTLAAAQRRGTVIEY